MTNQIILWSMIIVPYLSLFFLKKEIIKRYMPVALFTSLTGVILTDVGSTLKLWQGHATAYPLHHVAAYYLGLNVVVTIWVFYLTYRNFWVYTLTNVILDIGFNYIFLYYFMQSRGFITFNLPPSKRLLITISHSLLSYAFQKWQEEVLIKVNENGRERVRSFKLLIHRKEKAR